MSGFRHFWPYYLRAHLDPRARAFHYLGTLVGIALFGVGLIRGPWWLIPFAFGAGYFLAGISHFLFEGNRPATLISPHWSFVGDFYMLGLFLTGRLGREIARVQHLADKAEQGIRRG